MKLIFNFQTRYNGKLLDDTVELGKPMELIIGKKFVINVWEEKLKEMINENLNYLEFTGCQFYGCSFIIYYSQSISLTTFRSRTFVVNFECIRK